MICTFVCISLVLQKQSTSSFSWSNHKKNVFLCCAKDHVAMILQKPYILKSRSLLLLWQEISCGEVYIFRKAAVATDKDQYKCTHFVLFLIVMRRENRTANLKNTYLASCFCSGLGWPTANRLTLEGSHKKSNKMLLFGTFKHIN